MQISYIVFLCYKKGMGCCINFLKGNSKITDLGCATYWPFCAKVKAEALFKTKRYGPFPSHKKDLDKFSTSKGVNIKF